MEHIQRETNKTPRPLTEQIQRKYKRLARLDEVFASGDKVIALAIRKTERTNYAQNSFLPKLSRRIPMHVQFYSTNFGGVPTVSGHQFIKLGNCS